MPHMNNWTKGPWRKADYDRQVVMAGNFGKVEVCDGDGYCIPNRQTREGFVLTKNGKNMLYEFRKNGNS